jgi:DNA-binding PadR family transcriptional regulator
MGASEARKPADKSMTSPVNWALLGLVIARPSYGLELAHRFQRIYADVLPVSGESHIYSALDALKKRGMIAIIPGAGVVRQPKLHYQATQRGVKSYEGWVVDQVNEERRRRELWVRQLAIFARNPETAIHVIGRFEGQYLKGAGQAQRSPADSGIESLPSLVEDLVAEEHRIAVGGMLSWLRYARERFEARIDEPQTNGPARA